MLRVNARMIGLALLGLGLLLGTVAVVSADHESDELRTAHLSSLQVVERGGK